jgi:hypothetical protein
MTWPVIAAVFVIAMILLVIAVWAARDRRQEAAWRCEDDQADANVRGRHRAPRGAVVVPRPPTGGTPPWDYQSAPVLEPAAVISGPPEPEPVPDAYIIATGTLTDGRLHARIAVLPPLPEPSWPGELHPEVAAQLGHATTDAAVDSIFNRVMAAQVRELTDGAP